ncbi:hypothetical protein LOK49_LG07G03476 [Camellia lanceoleosa]|uniref:Uncharacterized protein n=1 Tax=Camellia lanceoleosa TaxID=1840588 RepID=A0ACC0H4X0_9ERIC|nr:hypothetical protein LOK49_LG07G03476 [Camellia lanceoleosa]
MSVINPNSWSSFALQLANIFSLSQCSNLARSRQLFTNFRCLLKASGFNFKPLFSRYAQLVCDGALCGGPTSECSTRPAV